MPQPQNTKSSHQRSKENSLSYYVRFEKGKECHSEFGFVKIWAVKILGHLPDILEYIYTHTHPYNSILLYSQAERKIEREHREENSSQSFREQFFGCYWVCVVNVINNCLFFSLDKRSVASQQTIKIGRTLSSNDWVFAFSLI